MVVEARAVRRNTRLNARFDAGAVVERQSRETVGRWRWRVDGGTEAAQKSELRGLRALPAAGLSAMVVEARAVRRNTRLNARFDAGAVVERHRRETVAVEGRWRHGGGAEKRTAQFEGASSG